MLECLSFKNAPNASNLLNSLSKMNITWTEYESSKLPPVKLPIYTNYKNKDVFKIIFPAPISREFVPSSAMKIIGEFNPLDIRVLNMEYKDAMALIFYQKFKGYISEMMYFKSFLQEMKIKPTYTALEVYYRKKKQRSPCGEMTKKGTRCKILTCGSNRCGHHKRPITFPILKLNYEPTLVAINVYRPTISLERRIDPESGGVYTRDQFLQFYGNYDIWDISQRERRSRWR